MSDTVLTVLIILAAIAFIGGIFSDLINLIAVLAISVGFIVYSFVNKSVVLDLLADLQSNDLVLPVIVPTAIAASVGVLRGSPLIWSWRQHRAYLILGTLVSETDYRAGIGASLGYGILIGVSSYFCFDSAMNKMSVIIFTIPGMIMAGLCLLSFIFIFIARD